MPGSLNAAWHTLELFDDDTGTAYPALMFYPGTDPEGPGRLGPYDLQGAKDGAPAVGPFPLVVISHGTGGSHLIYRDLGAYLARAGYVVISPEHPRNNRNNNELGGTAENLRNRPRHIRQVIDWAAGKASVDAQRTAVIGHSLGGYSALAVAGGHPVAFGHETPDRIPREIEVEPDPRVRALVLLAPATPWFMGPDRLRDVRIPVLMFTAGKDPHTQAIHGDVVAKGIPDPSLLEHHVVAGGGHFAFVTPFPAPMCRPDFPPSQDPEGFDRVAFLQRMNVQVGEFLDRVLRSN